MKKTCALLLAICAALSMKATIYVIGDGNGLTWNLPGKPIESEDNVDNVYTFSVANLSTFKASINYSFLWDGYGSFNAGCLSTGAATFSSSEVYPDGQTLPIEPCSEEQQLPYAGDYTITIDYNNMTMTAKAATPADGADDADGADGVDDVDIDCDLPVEYFNLYGARVENPGRGVFIARQGDKTIKIVK